jgi:hypothetical protein
MRFVLPGGNHLTSLPTAPATPSRPVRELSVNPFAGAVYPVAGLARACAAPFKGFTLDSRTGGRVYAL